MSASEPRNRRTLPHTWTSLASWLRRSKLGDDRSVVARERLRQNLISTVLLMCVGLAYALLYFRYELYVWTAITLACVALGLFAPLLAWRGRLVAAAHLLSFSVFVVVASTSYASDGLNQPGYAWIYIIPLIAGLLGGGGALLIWSGVSFLTTLSMFYGGIGPLRVAGRMPEAVTAEQAVFDIALLFVTLALIVSAFLRIRSLAEAETSSALEELAEEVETRRRAEEAARKADQAKSAFLASMSHEIRTPMNGVLGLTDLLLELELGEQQRGFAEVIKSSSESLMSILNDILDYSKIEAGRMELESAPFDVRGVIEQAVQLLAGRAHEKRIDLLVDLDPAMPARVVGDAVRLRQVLMNLVGNAVKFTPAGEVEVDLVVDRQTASTVQFSVHVKDTGVGIAPESVDRLFRPFSQADAGIARQFGGTGLGLAISHRMISLMGGQIGVQSQPGAGSTFTIALELPCDWTLTAERPLALAGQRIAVVDSRLRRRELFIRQIAALGALCDGYRDAESARAILCTPTATAPVDVVLVSRQVDAEDDGLLLGAEIVRANPTVRVIALVEWGASIADGRLRDLGLAAQVSLPSSSAALLAALAGTSAPLRAASVMPVTLENAALILVVDDNVVNRRVAYHQLRRLGYRVIEAENGRDALEQVAAHSPAAVLMDIEMPVMDGYEATRRLREREAGDAHLPVIALTAHALAGYRERVIGAGMDGYLTKPLRREDLQATLSRVLAAGVLQQ